MNKDLDKQVDTMIERHRNGDVNRRDFLKFIGIAGAAVGLVGGPFGRLAWSAQSIRFDSWGGTTSAAFQKYAFDPFTKDTGIKVVTGEFGNADTYLTRVKASFPPGGEFNLAHLSGVFDYARYIDLGFGTHLNTKKIPNMKNVMPAMIKPLKAISKGYLSAVPYDYGQTGIAYNTKFVPKEKAEKLGVALLWDKDLKGNLGSWVDWRTNIWYAALKTGQNPNDIKDMKAVWAALKEQQPMIKKYWSSGAELMSLLANDEIYATPAWSGRVAHLQHDNYPIGFLSPKNCYSWQECIFVIKDTNMPIAEKLINYMLAPKAAIGVALAQQYPPSLDPTKVPMPEAVKNLPAFDPTGKLEGYLFANPKYWNSHQLKWTEKWDRIRSGM